MPHLKVVDGDDLKVVIQFVDTHQSEWDTEFRHESARWLEQCLYRGIRLIFVKVAGPEDVRAMFANDREIYELGQGYPFSFNVSWFRPRFRSGFMPFAKNVIRSIKSPRARGPILENQESADRQLLDLMRVLVLASPSVRQEFANMLEELGTFESIYPMSVANRHAHKLVDIRQVYGGDSYR